MIGLSIGITRNGDPGVAGARLPLALVVPPVIDRGNFTGGFDESGSYSYAGKSVHATPGQWAFDAFVKREWLKVTEWDPVGWQPTGFEHRCDGTELALTQDDLNEGFVYRETGYGKGGPVEAFVLESIVDVLFVVPPPATPYANYSAFPRISGNPWPGEDLTFEAAEGMFVGAVSVTQEWWKNGVATGSFTETYNFTAEGDVVFVRLTATNPGGSVTADVDPVLVGAVFEVLAETPVEMSTLVDGRTGSQTLCKRLQAKNHLAGTYEWNEGFFDSGLLEKLTCVKIALYGIGQPQLNSGGWHESFGGTLITPRHVISAGHAMPGSNLALPYPDRRWRFMSVAGAVHEAIQIAEGHPNYFQAGSDERASDTAVMLLSEDVPPGIAIAPMFPFPGSDSPEHLAAVISLLLSGEVHLNVSQASGYGGRTGPVYPGGSTKPLNSAVHESMAYLVPSAGVGGFDSWGYTVYGGDSGTPSFYVCNGQPFLQWYAAGVDVINSLILKAEERAIAAGTLDDYTGYQVRQATLQEIQSGTMTPQWWIPTP